MPSFLKDIRSFYGTGEKNAAGETLEEFLEKYDPDKYRTPSCTTDAVIFASKKPLMKELKGLKLLLVKRSNHPSIGYWALPGGFVNIEENLDDTARRELEEETGVRNLVMEQIASYGNYDRDPRARVITTAYMALVQGDEVYIQAGDDAADAVWCDVELKDAEVLSGTYASPIVENSENVEYAYKVQTYALHIRNVEKGLDTTATVIHKSRGGLVREEKYVVTEPGIIAADHAAIIVQALMILKSRL